ncbi:MAG: hypothetical protein AB8B78_07455 [Polaribacter sp.]
MEHDIRDLFNKNEETHIEISKNHRIEFLQKLAHQHKKKSGFQSKNIYKIGAFIAIILVCIVYYFNSNHLVDKTPLQIQVAEIEKEYLNNIDKEWNSFIKVANDSVLVNKYKIKMRDFDKDYQKITFELQENPNSINVLEALINNLQRRLELIKNIKEHLKELNQKNTSNETIYL